MPYIEFLGVTIPPELFIYAFFLFLGVSIGLLITMRRLGKLHETVTRRHNNMVNRSLEFVLEIGLRTGIDVKDHLKILEDLKLPA